MRLQDLITPKEFAAELCKPVSPEDQGKAIEEGIVSLKNMEDFGEALLDEIKRTGALDRNGFSHVMATLLHIDTLLRRKTVQ